MKLMLKTTLCLLSLAVGCQTQEQINQPMDVASTIEIDSVTGLVVDSNFEIVRGQCTACHSAKLITQNSATREGWEQMIRWMQKTQGLWELGENEELILDYLSVHYGPKKKGRRAPLTNIDWYYLQEQP